MLDTFIERWLAGLYLSGRLARVLYGVHLTRYFRRERLTAPASDVRSN